MDTRLTRQLIYGLFLLFVLGFLKRADAGQVLNVAVAANFAPALEMISKNFTEKSGIPVQLTVSSSGRLYAQIENGAPFDLFFSADTKRPTTLHVKGLCTKPELYATGQTVLWTKKNELCGFENWEEVLQSTSVERIAMANPNTAPYGTVAKDICTQQENWPLLKGKMVYGSNVGQAFQYAQAEAVQVSFVAMSLALSEKGRSGCFWEIKEAASVSQAACVPTNSNATETANHFLNYVTSIETAPLRKKFGYM